MVSRKAPKNEYRILATDPASQEVWLVADFVEYDAARVFINDHSLEWGALLYIYDDHGFYLGRGGDL